MIEFHYHGFYIRVLADANFKDSAWIIQQLQSDFYSFLSKKNIPNIEIQLVASFAKPKLRLRLFSSKLVQRFVSSDGPYYEGLGRFQGLFNKNGSGQTIFKVCGDNPQFIYEVVYAFILSTLGERLEAQGIHRIHGLGVSTDQKSLVVPLGSGQGKSSACHWLLENTNLKFLGEETIFTDGHSVYAFPIRRALREKDYVLLKSQQCRVLNRIYFEKKFLFSWPENRIKYRDENFSIVLFQKNFSFIKFGWSFFWGLGNAQMSEFLIRADNLHVLIYIAISRIKSLFRLRRRIVYLNFWEEEPEINWANLKSFL